MEERFEEAVANNKEEDLNGFAIGFLKLLSLTVFQSSSLVLVFLSITFRILICLARTCHFVIYNTNQSELDCPYRPPLALKRTPYMSRHTFVQWIPLLRGHYCSLDPFIQRRCARSKGVLIFYTNHLVENLLLKYLTITFDVLGEGPAIKYIEISWRD